MLVLEILGKLQDGLNKKYNPDWKTVRTIDEFQTECMLETAELLECIRVKWWKQSVPCWEKAKLELVDILHFAISGAILKDELVSKPTSLQIKSDLEISSFKYLFNLAINHDFIGIIYTLINFANILKFDIISYYVAKFTLNKIRLLLGYRDGTYKKVVEGVEDNDLILKCIPESSETISLEKDYDISKYEQITKNVYDIFGIPLNQRNTLQSYI